MIMSIGCSLFTTDKWILLYFYLLREKEICSKHLTNICARNFLEKREKRMWKFIAEFQKLSLSDEKVLTPVIKYKLIQYGFFMKIRNIVILFLFCYPGLISGLLLILNKD